MAHFNQQRDSSEEFCREVENILVCMLPFRNEEHFRRSQSVDNGTEKVEQLKCAFYCFYIIFYLEKVRTLHCPILGEENVHRKFITEVTTLAADCSSQLPAEVRLEDLETCFGTQPLDQSIGDANRYTHDHANQDHPSPQ